MFSVQNVNDIGREERREATRLRALPQICEISGNIIISNGLLLLGYSEAIRSSSDFQSLPAELQQKTWMKLRAEGTELVCKGIDLLAIGSLLNSMRLSLR